MINVNIFREHIVAPAIKILGLWSEEAESLVLGTAIQESGLDAIKQYHGGPALGFFQMEPDTYQDIWANFLKYNPVLKERVASLSVRNTREVMDQGLVPDPEEIMYNMRFAAAMCRIHYYRQKPPIPEDVEGQAQYWKDHYNTHLGAGTPEEYIEKWYHYVN